MKFSSEGQQSLQRESARQREHPHYETQGDNHYSGAELTVAVAAWEPISHRVPLLSLSSGKHSTAAAGFSLAQLSGRHRPITEQRRHNMEQADRNHRYINTQNELVSTVSTETLCFKVDLKYYLFPDPCPLIYHYQGFLSSIQRASSIKLLVGLFTTQNIREEQLGGQCKHVQLNKSWSQKPSGGDSCLMICCNNNSREQSPRRQPATVSYSAWISTAPVTESDSQQWAGWTCWTWSRHWRQCDRWSLRFVELGHHQQTSIATMEFFCWGVGWG